MSATAFLRWQAEAAIWLVVLFVVYRYPAVGLCVALCGSVALAAMAMLREDGQRRSERNAERARDMARAARSRI